MSLLRVSRKGPPWSPPIGDGLPLSIASESFKEKQEALGPGHVVSPVEAGRLCLPGHADLRQLGPGTCLLMLVLPQRAAGEGGN